MLWSGNQTFSLLRGQWCALRLYVDIRKPFYASTEMDHIAFKTCESYQLTLYRFKLTALDRREFNWICRILFIIQKSFTLKQPWKFFIQCFHSFFFAFYANQSFFWEKFLLFSRRNEFSGVLLVTVITRTRDYAPRAFSCDAYSSNVCWDLSLDPRLTIPCALDRNLVQSSHIHSRLLLGWKTKYISPSDHPPSDHRDWPSGPHLKVNKFNNLLQF